MGQVGFILIVSSIWRFGIRQGCVRAHPCPFLNMYIHIARPSHVETEQNHGTPTTTWQHGHRYVQHRRQAETDLGTLDRARPTPEQDFLPPPSSRFDHWSKRENTSSRSGARTVVDGRSVSPVSPMSCLSRCVISNTVRQVRIFRWGTMHGPPLGQTSAGLPQLRHREQSLCGQRHRRP